MRINKMTEIVAPLSRCLYIEPVDDWTKSLIKVGGK